jgi:hypothetical protein
LNSRNRQRHAKEERNHNGERLTRIRRQGSTDNLPNVIVDCAPLANRCRDRSKIVIR